MTDAWLAATTTRVALPGRPGDHHDPHVTITDRERDEFINAAAATESGARVTAFKALITRLAADPRTAYRLVVLFAYQPADALTFFSRLLEDRRRWSTTVEVYEAWVALASAGELPGMAPHDQATALAYLIRTRWHLYAAAFAGSTSAWLERRDWIRISDLDSEQEVASAARRARADWVDVLDRLEEFPTLARDLHDPVVEAQWLVERRLSTSLLPDGDPAGIGVPVSGVPTPDDHEVQRHCVRNHLLPRFVLGTSWQVAWRLASRFGRMMTVVAGGLFTLAVLAALGGAYTLVPYGVFIAAGAAALGYTAVLIAAVTDRSLSWPWLLRQPASGGAGLLVLISLGTGWWQGSAKHGATVSEQWLAGASAAVLLMVGSGYLILEAVNHGVRPLRRRVAAVAGTGLLHSVLVSVMVLAVLLPAFVDHGPDLAGCWAHGHCAAATLPPWLLIAVTSAWAYAAGVFIQIVWDDQPITAPLAHLRWRSGR